MEKPSQLVDKTTFLLYNCVVDTSTTMKKFKFFEEIEKTRRKI